MAKSTSSYLPVIDLLRGVASMAVCLFHFICKTKAFITGTFIVGLFYYGHFGVHMFFVISGMVIPLSMIKGQYTLKSWPRFLWKRFLRIEPPYIVAVILGTLFLIARNYIPGTTPGDRSPSLSTFLLHIGYLIPFRDSHTWISPVFWTLAIEFQYYLVLSILFPLAMHPLLTRRIMFYAIFLAAGYFHVTSEDFLPFWMPLFLIGIMYVLWWSGKIASLEYWLVSLAAMIVVYWRIGPASLVTALITIAIVHFFSTFSTPLSNFFGKISYSLYLLHSIVGAAFVNVLSHHAHSAWEKGFILIGGIGVSILSAFLFYIAVEKPSQLLSAKVKY
jgi:peptidoglycan/LPS O-acetylase OafA/YrhL